MSSQKLASISETRDAAAYFVSYNDVVSVDEEGFITVGSERLEIGKDDEKHPVSIYQDPMPDAKETGTYWVLNPFSTKAQPSFAMRMLVYRVQRNTIGSLIAGLLKIVIQCALTNKEIDVQHDEFSPLELNLDLREILAGKTEQKKVIASEIDEKMFSEVLMINDTKVIPELVQRLFVTSKLSTHINIPFLNNEKWFEETFEITLRKKTLHVFKAIILRAFDVKDGAELIKNYTGVQEDGEPANFASGMRMLYKVHKALNKYYIGIVESNIVDLEMLSEHIDNIKRYTKRARMMTSEKIVKPKVSEAKLGKPSEPTLRPSKVSRYQPRVREEEEEPPRRLGLGRRSLRRAEPVQPANVPIWDRLPSRTSRSVQEEAPRARTGFGRAARTPVSSFGSSMGERVARAPFIRRR